MRGRIQLLALFAMVGFGSMAIPNSAVACVENDCKPARETTSQTPQTSEQPQPARKPLKLAKFRDQPVALGKATRVVKKPDGAYARVKLSRRARTKAPEAPQFLPVVVSPEAEASLAMQDSVRVVEPGELNDIDRAAEPIVPVLVTTTSEPPLRVANAAEISARKSDEGLPTPSSAAPAAEPSTGWSAWLLHRLSWLGERFVAAFAAVRNLFG